MITVAALSPALDVTYLVDALDGIQRPREVHRTAGGKALNAARAAVLLGGDVEAVAVLGGGTGAVVAEAARADGLPLTVVEQQALTRTCVSVHAADHEGLTEIYEPAPAPDERAFQALLSSWRARLAQRPGWCVVSGGMPAGLGPDVLVRLLDGLPPGCRTAVDSHGPALRRLLADGPPPDLLKVNRAEAAEATGEDPAGELGVLADALRAATGGLVVVTDGPAGARGVDAAGSRHAALTGVHGSYPVGSGDAFLGGMLVALDRGDDLTAALRTGTGAAAANALVPGAGRFDPAVARDLAARTSVGASAREPA
ncbi:1-phosphofructokinase family hexose kinase [Cellulomonas massiliensis]|uniref:1-phosphofructokinase family hexose kinase n=1 Tax=Cellulomonas massiliensis TaxID=1465811 RepID=UPI00031A6DF7|nr:PfkB family carbohydrate kinase [Cellulomonas massiliensis]